MLFHERRWVQTQSVGGGRAKWAPSMYRYIASWSACNPCIRFTHQFFNVHLNSVLSMLDLPCCIALVLCLISELFLILYADQNGADPSLLMHGIRLSMSAVRVFTHTFHFGSTNRIRFANDHQPKYVQWATNLWLLQFRRYLCPRCLDARPHRSLCSQVVTPYGRIWAIRAFESVFRAVTLQMILSYVN